MTSPRTRIWHAGLEHGARISVGEYCPLKGPIKPRVFGDPTVPIFIAQLLDIPDVPFFRYAPILTHPLFVSCDNGPRKNFYQVVHDRARLQVGRRRELIDDWPLVGHYSHVDTPLGLLCRALLGSGVDNTVKCFRSGNLWLRAPTITPLEVVIEEFAVTAVLQGGQLLTDQVHPFPFRNSDAILTWSRFFSLPV